MIIQNAPMNIPQNYPPIQHYQNYFPSHPPILTSSSSQQLITNKDMAIQKLI